jgi:dienelactone hydrolase
VDYRSYAAPLRELAAQGFLVILVPVRLNLAFFEINAGQAAIDANPQIEHWVVGGHSLGGVASALFAKDNPDIDGIIFWHPTLRMIHLRTQTSKWFRSTAQMTWLVCKNLKRQSCCFHKIRNSSL